MLGCDPGDRSEHKQEEVSNEQESTVRQAE